MMEEEGIIGRYPKPETLFPRHSLRLPPFVEALLQLALLFSRIEAQRPPCAPPGRAGRRWRGERDNGQERRQPERSALKLEVPLKPCDWSEEGTDQ